jgi:hypothetical protein
LLKLSPTRVELLVERKIVRPGLGAIDLISPDATGAILGHDDEALEPSPDDWELCHDPR